MLVVNYFKQPFQHYQNILGQCYQLVLLSTMFSHIDSGLSPMPRTETGHFFLDVNPKFFEIVLEWLRLGETITDDPGLLKGALSMANYFGLDELIEELEAVIQKKNITSGKRKCYPDMFDLAYRNGTIILSVRKIKITRVSESLINRYLNGEDIYLPISYHQKSGSFVLDRVDALSKRTDQHCTVKNAFQFLDSDSFHTIETRPQNILVDKINEIKEYLKMFGIYENAHYKVEKATTFGKGLTYNLQWNEEFIMKYADTDVWGIDLCL